MSGTRLAGKSAIVTGAARGIGLEIARCFASEGAGVLVVDIDANEARAAADAIRSGGGNAAAFAADVGARGGAQPIVDAALEHFGGVHILVNNAALIKAGSIFETPLDLWDAVIGVNLTGTFLCAQAAAKAMVAGGWGRIINISSHQGLLGSSKRVAYSASKGGVLALTRAMAADLAESGVTVNAIAPGNIATRNLDTMEPSRRAAWDQVIPMRRFGTVGELAGAALFLASDDSSYITGQTLAVDGGFSTSGVLMRDDPKEKP